MQSRPRERPQPPHSPPLIVLLGPTAVGKTALSLDLCRRFNGEVVSADSRQVYRMMDIGTAKPTAAEQAQIPHHLLDVCDPNDTLSLAQYQRLAYAAIDGVHHRGRTPFLVGGTALYLRAVVQGLRIPEVPPNPALRAELEAYAAKAGHAALHRRLQQLDPVTAARIDARNVRRVVRALEIVLTMGKSKSELEGADPPPYRILQIGLDRPRTGLHARIDERVDRMVEQGLIEETRRLLAAGYAPTLPSMTSLGYREITDYLQAKISLDEATTKIKTETHRFVRHQYSWFRHTQGIHWFDLSRENVQAIHKLVAGFLAQGSPARP